MSLSLETVSNLDERAPRSASWFPANLAGLAAALFVLWILRNNASYSDIIKGALAALATLVVIGSYEYFVAHVTQRPSTGIARGALRSLSLPRVVTRLTGLVAIYAVIAFAYWAFPEYHGSAFYQPFWTALRMFGPWIVIGTLAYFLWMDTRQRDSDDAYVQLGKLIWLFERPAKWGPLRELIAGWAVKAYFLPLMTVYFASQVHDIAVQFNGVNDMSLSLFRFLFSLSFTIDLLFALVGYTCTMRLFDSHIRTVEPTAFGCVIALLCYQPFFSIIGNNYVHYQGSLYWDNAFAAWPAFRYLWGMVVIFLCLAYCLSTAAFGLRFSNLTHRGIITSGPYRYTKHPAYITKCLSFWMISVPFIEPLGWQIGLRHCFALSLICVIYFLRARTEERHLMRDPDYRVYAAWMAEHGLFAKARKLFS